MAFEPSEGTDRPDCHRRRHLLKEVRAELVLARAAAVRLADGPVRPAAADYRVAVRCDGGTRRWLERNLRPGEVAHIKWHPAPSPEDLLRAAVAADTGGPFGLVGGGD
jgi:hypothetical protein